MNGSIRDGTLSRATSVSRASRQGSTLSRSQSLIKKNIESHDLRPSDVLIERFIAWKAIVKQLVAYFEGVADIQNNTAREMTKLVAVIQVPFRSGNQFLGEGGMQDIFYNIRNQTRVVADQHANLGRTVEGSIVQHLQKVLEEIKSHIKNIQNDTGKLATSVARERELSTKCVGDLAASLSANKHTPNNLTSKSDPYVANQFVHRQLLKQVHEENLLQKSIIIMQQNSAHFEEGIVRAIQSAWQTFNEWQSRMNATLQEVWTQLGNQMAALPPDKEWITFSARSDHLLDPETPLRNPNAINYPGKDDPSIHPVHTGHLERKKRFTRSYRESFFVLTPAGFLHEYDAPQSVETQIPLFSLFLPTCTLGPPSGPRANSHKFHIEGSKEGTGTTKTGSLRKVGSPSAVAWSFRARSHDDMMEWWNDIRMLCARYLVASDTVERGGVVDAAVRSVGYPSEDEEEILEEEEEEEEEEGSSIEEEREEVPGAYPSTTAPAAPDAYAQPQAAPPLEREYELERKVTSPRPDYAAGIQAGAAYPEEKHTAVSHSRGPQYAVEGTRSPVLQAPAEAVATHSPHPGVSHPGVSQYRTTSPEGVRPMEGDTKQGTASGGGLTAQNLSRSVSPGHISGPLSPPISSGHAHFGLAPSGAQPIVPVEQSTAKNVGVSATDPESFPVDAVRHDVQPVAPVVGGFNSKFKEGL
ncbi:hypothetical protein AX16_002146 [Volvariella volvacea WC 439]|nr:hypothetical protein AX16_002146 [Volvariella volvacea WC 439]